MQDGQSQVRVLTITIPDVDRVDDGERARSRTDSGVMHAKTVPAECVLLISKDIRIVLQAPGTEM